MTATIRRYYWREDETSTDGYLITGTQKGATWVSAADAWCLCQALADHLDAEPTR